jgi:hypothetical protein
VISAVRECNEIRIHLSIDRMSPVRYENLWAAVRPAETA